MGRHVIDSEPGKRCDLYKRPKIKWFGATSTDSLATLANYLQTLDNNTSLHHIADPSEIKMTNGAEMLHDGFKFTSSAFRQAAQILCPGLSKLLPDLAGTVAPSKDGKIASIDGPCAVKLWNNLIDLRFALFARYRIIRNDQERTIEGFVSHKHQYLENIWLYREAVETLAHYDANVAIYAALLIGRRFAIWFRHNVPLFTLDVDGQPWPFYGGYYFTNGEATGTSVRGTLAIFTPRGICLGAYRKYGRRVTHVGKDFMARLGQMFDSVVHCEIPKGKLEDGAKALLAKPLAYDVTWNKDQRKERSKKISHALGVLGVQKNLAVEATELALAIGRHHGMEVVDWAQVNHMYASRTALDLFVPLMGLARKVDLARREKLEQAAFDMLMGRLLL